MKLEDLEIYREAMELADEVWAIVNEWDHFERTTVWRQLVTAVDSIAANISEGYGRYHFKQKQQFCYYRRGSLFETKCWLSKSCNRNLVQKQKYQYFIEKFDILGKKLNNYITSIDKKYHQ